MPLNRTFATCALATVVALAACGKASARSARIYVSNENDGTISVIDSRTRGVIASIPVGKRPRGLRVSHDARWLYVALSGSPKGGPGVDESALPPADRSADGIGVVDLEAMRLVRTIASGQDPEAFDLVGDDRLVVSNEETAEASLVSLTDGTVRARVAVGREPEGVATTPDGQLVFVTSEADSQVSVIDPSSMKVLTAIPTGARPRGIAFAHDGGAAYVTNETDGTVSILDAHAFAASGKIEIGNTGSSAIGPRPMGIAVARGSRILYVTTGRGGSLAVIDPDLRKVLRVVAGVGPRPWGVGVGPDGLVYTANGSSDDVAVIDPDAAKVIARIHTGGSPWGIAIDR